MQHIVTTETAISTISNLAFDSRAFFFLDSCRHPTVADLVKLDILDVPQQPDNRPAMSLDWRPAPLCEHGPDLYQQASLSTAQLASS